MADRQEIDWVRRFEPWRLHEFGIEEQVEEVEVPNESWTERRIKEWIELKGLPIKYDIKRRTKKWALNQIQLN